MPSHRWRGTHTPAGMRRLGLLSPQKVWPEKRQDRGKIITWHFVKRAHEGGGGGSGAGWKQTNESDFSGCESLKSRPSVSFSIHLSPFHTQNHVKNQRAAAAAAVNHPLLTSKLD